MNLFENIYNDIILESIDLKPPVNDVRHIPSQYNSSTGNPPKTTYSDNYIFITSHNNTVSIQFDRYNIIQKNPPYAEHGKVEIGFVVNGKFDRKWARKANPSFQGRDPEILSGILYLVLDYINKHEKIIDIIEMDSYKEEDNNPDNKRQNIYMRLIKRYINNKWDVDVLGDVITLRKK